MRSDRVVILSPLFDQNLRLFERVEDLSVEQFISQASIEALDHDAAFISASVVASLELSTVTANFITLYVLTAQRRSLSISISLAITVWLAATLALVPVQFHLMRRFLVFIPTIRVLTENGTAG